VVFYYDKKYDFFKKMNDHPNKLILMTKLD
jgi:hypothetical protein